MSDSLILRDYPILIPYQVDFNTATTGKHISVTKRHVWWKFGFAHISSLLAGETGASCRGLELEVKLVWSVASGKYVIYLNKIPLQKNSKPSGMVNKFEHWFPIPEKAFPGMHRIVMTVWATTIGVPPGEQQFNMTFDGQRFNDFFRIFELGEGRMKRTYGNALNNLVDNGKVHLQIEENRGVSDTHSIVGERRRYRHAPAVERAIVRSPSDPYLHAFGKANAERQNRPELDQPLSGRRPYPDSLLPDTPKRSGVAKTESRKIHSEENLIYFEDNDPPPVLRCTSSVTLDTMLQDSIKKSFDQEADEHHSTAYYSHLDPQQMSNNQQNLSFRLQSPPVYADSIAGDLIQPTNSFVTNDKPQGNVGYQTIPMAAPNTSHLNARGPPSFAPVPFQTAPPPTWESLNSAFSNQHPQPNVMSNQQY